MKRLAQLLELAQLTHVVDIGANPIDGDPPYKKMLEAGVCKVTGFEPQAEALAQLQARKGPYETYLPHVIGDGTERILNICKASGMTSLLTPDQRTLSLFDVLRPLGEVIDRITTSTIRLDDVVELTAFDMLKIDVQGAELEIFQSGRLKLNNAVAIQTEVSFVTLYENQPSFGDIDLELRSQGFIPHSFPAIKKWPISPCVINGDPRQPLNQLLEADIVYIRDLSRVEHLSPDQIKQLAFIGHCCFGSLDLTMYCIRELQNRGVLPGNALDRYVELLQSQTETTSGN
ncbi:MAG: FkbM family methyltransferase [Rhodocyclaceae bacterium]|nr:MAG: FkbM family methyltransferase [Rhodocyclaceae bacterium]